MRFPYSVSVRVASVLACMLALAAPARAEEAPASNGLIIAGLDANEVLGPQKFSDMPLDVFLQHLERITGRIILRPPALPAAQLTLNAEQPLTRGEAVLAMESLLSLSAIGVTPVGDRFMKVVPIAQIRAEAPELIVGSLLHQPPSGRVVSKLFRLQYLDPTSFQAQAAPFLSGFGSIVPFQNSNAVIVTDTVSNLQRLEYVVSEVDRRVNIETKFYQINYATASELAQQIRAMIESARSGMAGGGGARFTSVPQPGNVAQPAVAVAQPAAEGVPLQVVFSSNTSINSDDRTNQLIIVADPANLPFFDNVIEKLDIPAEPPTAIEVIYMKHAIAEELAGVLSQIISGNSQQHTSGRTTTPRPRSAPFGRTTPAENTPPRPIDVQRQQTVQDTVNSVQTERSSQFSDFMTVIADERSNSIIVSGTNSDIALVKEVIDRLDVLLAQVRIEVVIAEVTLSKKYERGIDAFGFSYDENSGDFTFNPTSAPITGNGTDDFLTGTIHGKTLSNVSINAVVNAGRTNTDVNILSVPTIVTTHNQEATIIVGQARPIVSTTSRGIGTDIETTSAQYQDIGIELVVTPRIGPNDIIQLEIDQKVDDVGEETISIDGNEQPVILRRQATSFLSVKNDQLIVLGGMRRSRIANGKSRMFLLGEIPIIGDLIFSRTSKTDEKTELLVFLKPTVIRTTEDADANARASINRLHQTPDNTAEIHAVTGESTPVAEPEPEPVKRPRAVHRP